MFTENQTIDNMHRQSSRSMYNSDAIDCIVNTNDLAFEPDLVKQDYEPKRTSSDSRRNQTTKRTNGSSTDRSSRHSPPIVTHKRPSSPSSTSLLPSRSQHHYYSSQKHPQVSRSPSPPPVPPPPPPSQTSSRHHRSSRPVTSVKRPHSHSRSPHERRPSTHRSYPAASKRRTNDNEELTSTPSVKKQSTSTKTSRKPDLADLSIISEDEYIKPHDNQSNYSTINESPSTNKLHSTPSVPVLQPTSNSSLLEMSHIAQDAELSLFAKSALSTTNTSSISTATHTLPPMEFMQIIDLMSKYKMMQAIPSANPQVEACSKDIFVLIQKQIDLHKKELDYREREMKLRDREFAEREKRFNEKSNASSSLIALNNQPVVTVKSTIIEEKPPQELEVVVNQDIKNVLLGESVEQSIPKTIDAPKVDLVNTNTSDKPSSTRKNHGKSRFSQLTVDPAIFASQDKPIVDLYAYEDVDDQSSSSIHAISSLKKTVLSPVLAPSESMKSSLLDNELKITSSNSCRKVEIQSDNTHKSSTSKEPSQDLRLTLRKNRTTQQQQQQHNVDDSKTNDDQAINAGEQIVTINKITLTKTISNTDDKQQSHDYQQQRSVTSTSIEAIVDDRSDKRDNRRHQQQQQQQQRINSSRSQQQYSGDNPSPSTTGSNERAYAPRSTSQQSSKYESNQKRQETDDLRSRLFEPKYPKPSRSTHRNNH